jgi:hypothetical protein
MKYKEDITQVGVKETGCEAVDWTHVAHDEVQRWTLVNSKMYLCISLKAWNFLSS